MYSVGRPRLGPWAQAYFECLLEGREVYEFPAQYCLYCEPGWLCPVHHNEMFQ